jgi:hypothetical protein
MSGRNPLVAALFLALPSATALADGFTVPEPAPQIFGGTETEQRTCPATVPRAPVR